MASRQGDHWTVTGDQAGVRLDKFLAGRDRLGSRGRAGTALERGKVFVNDQAATPSSASRRLEAGDAVRVWHDRPGSARTRLRRPTKTGDLKVIYEDEALIAVDKPPGVLTVPLAHRRDAPSVAKLLEIYLRARGRHAPFVVHRIDRDTSGLVLFATRRDVGERVRDAFTRRAVARLYAAVVHGQPQPAAGTWHDRLVWEQESLTQRLAHPADSRGAEARSDYRTVETFAHASLVEVSLVSGLRNQIRLQAALRGHMLVGERQYVSPVPPSRPIAFSRQALHARRIALRHPLTGRWLELESPLPPDLVLLLESLRRQPRRSYRA